MPTRTIRLPRPEAAKASATVWFTPTASITRLAGPPSLAATASRQVTRSGVDHLSAEPGAQVPARRADVGHGHVGDTEPPGSQQAGLPDRATTDDQHAVFGGGAAATHGVVAHGQRLHQRPELGRHALRQDHHVSRRGGDPVGERRRDLRGHAEHHAAAAPLLLTIATRRAGSAGHHRVDGDQLAGREVGYAGAELVDPADRLVAHHLAGMAAPVLPGVAVEVRAADAGGDDLDDHLARSPGCGSGRSSTAMS